MKTIILNIIAFFCLLNFTNFKAQSVSLTINCPGTATAGSTINVDAAYGYSNISGNITVVVNYDATKVTFCGSPSFATAPVLTGTGATSSLTYIFPATSGANQTGAIQIQFCAICPQTCFGTSNIANFGGNISAPAATSVTATSCGTNIAIVNNWILANNFVGYDCKANTVTFRLNIYGSTCYKINNPTISISSSIGTLISTSSGTISGSTISLAAPLSPTSSYWTYSINYTIQLPCTYTTGPVNTTAVLNGDNCGVYTPNLQTASAIFNVAPQNISAQYYCQVTANTYTVHISNNGSIPISANMSAILPNLNYSGFSHYTSQVSPTLSCNYTTYNCGLTASASVPFTSSTTVGTIPFSGSIKKMDYTVTNLQPGQYFELTFNYSASGTTCLALATLPYVFNTTGTYSSSPDPSACNCKFDTQSFVVGSGCSYNPTPATQCTGWTYDNNVCHHAGEVLHFCMSFYNYGDTALLGGLLNLSLPSYLNIIPSSVYYDSSPASVSAGIVTLPSPIANGSIAHTVCFDATVNSLAINGLHTYYPKISGSNMTVRNLCQYQVLICQDAKAEISKLVKGSEDATFSSSGSGMPGTNATYRITVKNSGNTPISSIEVVDRLPQPGDVFIRDCTTPRGSAFSVLPTGSFPAVPPYIPLIPSSITYDSSPTGQNKVPPSWLSFLTPYSCDISGSFSLSLANTVHINLPSPILPFNDYTFDMVVAIPTTAKPGEQICNSVALKTKYQDETGAEHDLEVIESNKVCLTIAPPPCNPCKEIVKSETLTVNPGTITSATQPYVIKTGYVTITTLKPVQEIHINISDLQYHFNKPECTNCKTPALSRGGIFPMNTAQSVGTLVWDDYTGSSIPSTTPLDNLPEELIWKIGVMIPPGTYTIPFQITLPKSLIPDCCELVIDKFALKISLKDVDCNLCESFVIPNNEDCCTGSIWKSKQMTWSNIILTHADAFNKNNIQTKKQQNDYNEAVSQNKLIKSGAIIANPFPLYGVLNITCGETYHILEGDNRSFNGIFKCNPNLKNCRSESLVSITTISGDYINVINQPMPYNRSFNLPGIYTVKFTGECNGTVCNTCEYTLIVDKNCCAGIVKKTPTSISLNHWRGPNTTATLSFPPIPHYSAYTTSTVHLDYSCVQGCASNYTWIRKRAGAVIDSGSSTISTINFAPPSSGEDLITITANCGTQNCYKTESFYLGCEICSIIFTGGHSIRNNPKNN